MTDRVRVGFTCWKCGDREEISGHVSSPGDPFLLEATLDIKRQARKHARACKLPDIGCYMVAPGAELLFRVASSARQRDGGKL